jgi:hypothetical protein
MPPGIVAPVAVVDACVLFRGMLMADLLASHRDEI